MRRKYKYDHQVQQRIKHAVEHILGHQGPVALGLDMAADTCNWGLCVIGLDENLSQGDLWLLLPQAARLLDGRPHATEGMFPSRDNACEYLKLLLSSLSQKRLFATLAVDVPFGWPKRHICFVKNWSAEHGWLADADLPTRSEFQYRLTDERLGGHFGLLPRSVSSESIGQVAYEWARLRHQLVGYLGVVDVGLGRPKVGLTTFETYPAALVKSVASSCCGYRSGMARRKPLLKHLKSLYPLRVDEWHEVVLQWAIDQKGSPNALDAILCAFAGWDHLRYRQQPESVPLSTPRRLLGQGLTIDDKQRIVSEGWILVRTAS